MLAEALPELVARTELETMYSDGGYNSAEVDTICHDEGVELVQTAIRGGKPSNEQVNLSDFTFVLDEAGKPVGISCPKGKTGIVEAGRKAGRYTATFMRSDCVDCPLLADCQMRVLKKTAARRLYFTIENVRLARRRQRMVLERKSGRNLRSAVEATVREISCRLEHGRLRVRGKFRVSMTMVASAAMANARRICRYRLAEKMAVQKPLGDKNEQPMGIFMKATSLFRLARHMRGKVRFFAPQSLFFVGVQNLRAVF